MNEGLAELSKYVFRFEAPCLLSFHVIMGLHLLIKKQKAKVGCFGKSFYFCRQFQRKPINNYKERCSSG